MNDECTYSFLTKEVKVQHIDLVQEKDKQKISLQCMFECIKALYDKRKEYEQHCIFWRNATVILKQIIILPLCVEKVDHTRNGQIKYAYNV